MPPRLLLTGLAASASALAVARRMAEDDPPGDPSDDPERRWNVLIGVATAIVGNVLISCALNLQRYAHIRIHKQHQELSRSWLNGRRGKFNGRPHHGQGGGGDAARAAPIREEGPAADETTPLRGLGQQNQAAKPWQDDGDYDEEVGDPQSYLHSPYWWAGITLMTLGEAGNFLAYGFAPASTVSPLGVVALITNCIIAPVMLKEPFRARDLAGVLTAVAGAVVVVLSAKTNERRMGPDEIWDAISRWEFELYLGLTAATIAGLVWASRRYGEKTVLIDLGLVGLFGAYTALSTKGIASLLSDTLWRVITFPISYLLVFVLVATALMQIRYVNRALQRFPSTQVIPTQFVLFTISVIVGSAVLYRDFESVTAAQFGKFVGGCLLTFVGVYLITSGRPAPDDDDDDDDFDDGFESQEERIGLLRTESATENPDPAATPRRRSIGFSTPARTLSGAPRSLSQQHSDRSRFSIASSLATASTAAPSPTPLGVSGSPLENPWAAMTPPLDPAQPASLRQLDSAGSAGSASTSRPSSPSGDRQAAAWAAEAGARETPPRPPPLARRSVSRLVPGPLVTPLSGSLSGIVADSLRKRVDSPAAARAKRASVAALRDDAARPQLEEGLASQPVLAAHQMLPGPERAKPRSKSVSEPERAAGLDTEAGTAGALARSESVRAEGARGSGEA